MCCQGLFDIGSCKYTSCPKWERQLGNMWVTSPSPLQLALGFFILMPLGGGGALYNLSRYNKLVNDPRLICPSSSDVVSIKKSISFGSSGRPVAVFSVFSPSLASSLSILPLPSASISLNFSTTSLALQTGLDLLSQNISKHQHYYQKCKYENETSSWRRCRLFAVIVPQTRARCFLWEWTDIVGMRWCFACGIVFQHFPIFFRIKAVFIIWYLNLWFKCINVVPVCSRLIEIYLRKIIKVLEN